MGSPEAASRKAVDERDRTLGAQRELQSDAVPMVVGVTLEIFPADDREPVAVFPVAPDALDPPPFPVSGREIPDMER